MKEPYEKTKEMEGSVDSEDELFPLEEENELVITADDEEKSKAPSRKVKKIKQSLGWRRRLDDYFDAKRIRELLDDEVESDIQDSFGRKSSLNRIIEDLQES